MGTDRVGGADCRDSPHGQGQSCCRRPSAVAPRRLGRPPLCPAGRAAAPRRPFSRVGETEEGKRRYRAYFTADFLWHVALTAELAKADPPIRNPYLERRALNYYWAYFVPPAMIARMVQGRACARGLPAAERARRRAAVRRLDLSLRLVPGPARRPDRPRSPADHARGQRRRPFRALPPGSHPTCHSAAFASLNVDAMTVLGLPEPDDRQPAPLALVHAAACRRLCPRPDRADRPAVRPRRCSPGPRAARRPPARPGDHLQPIPRRRLLRPLRPRRHLDARSRAAIARFRRSRRTRGGGSRPRRASAGACCTRHSKARRVWWCSACRRAPRRRPSPRWRSPPARSWPSPPAG